MNNIILEKHWKSIIYSGSSTFEFSRIDSSCIPELNIGFNSLSNRCLILELPRNFKISFHNRIKENLTIEYFSDTNYIVLQLTDNAYFDLFNDLIISLYHRVKDISTTDLYTRELIATINKWLIFFEDITDDKLSKEIIEGLFGELIVLKNLINTSDTSTINSVLKGWTGPYNTPNDFNLEFKNIEVKTKSIRSNTITISSEYQLECENPKELELIIVSVEDDSHNGLSIYSIIKEIKTLVADLNGDISILYDALKQKGLNSKNLLNYDIYKFMPKTILIYDAKVDDFPKLIKSKIPSEISKVSYNLIVNQLEKYIISKSQF
jgi:hypothetical protein